MRLLVGLLVLVVVGISVAAGRGVPVPWAAACTVTGPEGVTLLEGPPADVAAAVRQPSAELAGALAAGPAVSCRIPPIRATGTPKEAPLGLTPRAQQLRSAVREQFGRIPDGGFGPEETLPGRRPDGEHSQGRAVDFFFRPHEDPEMAARGWALANWAVAHAEERGIRTVIYRDHIWTAWRSAQGWRPYRFGGADPDNPVNRHLDHVHIDVA